MRTPARIAAAVFLVCCVGVAVVLVTRHRSKPPVELTLQIAVEPALRVDFVAKEASSAKVKYLAGKGAGVKPNLAQRLEVKPLEDMGKIEARIGLQTRDQAERYSKQLLQTLQWQCGSNIQLRLEDQAIK